MVPHLGYISKPTSRLDTRSPASSSPSHTCGSCRLAARTTRHHGSRWRWRWLVLVAAHVAATEKRRSILHFSALFRTSRSLIPPLQLLFPPFFTKKNMRQTSIALWPADRTVGSWEHAGVYAREAPHQRHVSPHRHLRFMTMDTVFPASIPATSLRDIGSIMAVPSKTSSMPCVVGCMHVSRLV